MAVHPEDPCLIPSTHIAVTPLSVTPVPGHPIPCSDLLPDQAPGAHVVHRHACRKNTHTHKQGEN